MREVKEARLNKKTTMKKIVVIFSNGKTQMKGFYEVRDNQEEDLFIESLSHDLNVGWFIDDVEYP